MLAMNTVDGRRGADCSGSKGSRVNNEWWRGWLRPRSKWKLRCGKMLRWPWARLALSR